MRPEVAGTKFHLRNTGLELRCRQAGGYGVPFHRVEILALIQDFVTPLRFGRGSENGEPETPGGWFRPEVYAAVFSRAAPLGSGSSCKCLDSRVRGRGVGLRWKQSFARGERRFLHVNFDEPTVEEIGRRSAK